MAHLTSRKQVLLVISAEGKHPAPSRTRQLSPPALMVLGAQASGRVSHCQENLFLFLCTTCQDPKGFPKPLGSFFYRRGRGERRVHTLILRVLSVLCGEIQLRSRFAYGTITCTAPGTSRICSGVWPIQSPSASTGRGRPQVIRMLSAARRKRRRGSRFCRRSRFQAILK